MLAHAVESYLSVRRACGFDLKSPGSLLRSFAAFSEAKGKDMLLLKPPSSGPDWRDPSTSAPAASAR